MNSVTAFIDFGQTDGFNIPGRENDRDGGTRRVNLTDGRTVTLTTKGPYGFWFIEWEKGPTPDAINGAYTTAEAAYVALEVYLNNNYYNTKTTEKPVEIPTVKYKKVKKIA